MSINLRLIEWAGLLFIALAIFSLWRAHKTPGFNFSLFDLLMENGRVSRLACVFMGSWVLLTWIMVRLTIDGKMTDGYFTSYAVSCFAGIVAKLFATQPENKPQEPQP